MIGFFDSGVGGLTVLEEVHKRLPEYDTVYLGDSARAPYGEKTHDQLVTYAWQGIEWLFAQGCELVILACNSASASALREIQQTKLHACPGKRVLGVIRPTVEELAEQGFRNIAVFSTEATARSEAYTHEFHKINPNIHVISHACVNWGPMIEFGKLGTKELEDDIEKEIRAVKQKGRIDAVLLACTHYPYIKKDVEKMFQDAPVFDQGPFIALSLQDYLERHVEIDVKLTKQGQRLYFVTGSVPQAEMIARDRFGFDVHFKQMKIA